MKESSVAIIGATGIVGQELISLLDKREWNPEFIQFFASQSSRNETINFRGSHIAVHPFEFEPLDDVDLVFLCTNSEIARKYRPLTKAKCVIDLSSAFRTDADVPLVIPEINRHLLSPIPKWISSTNCVASLILLPLYPLHKEYQIDKIIASTYQATSGAGKTRVKQLLQESKSLLKKSNSPAGEYAFNLFLHESHCHENGYNEEEMKIRNEVHRILESPTIGISMTCVRVPVLRVHSISMHVQFHRKISLDLVTSLLKKTEGVKLFEDRKNNRFASPSDVSGKEDIHVSRIRKVPFEDDTLEFWIVGDQLLKGAALNAVQIAEQI